MALRTHDASANRAATKFACDGKRLGAELGEDLDEFVALRPDPVDSLARRFGVGGDGLLEDLQGQPRDRKGLADPAQPVHDPRVAHGVSGAETGAAPRLGEGPDEDHIGVVQSGFGEVELGVAELTVGLIVEHQGPRQTGQPPRRTRRG